MRMRMDGEVLARADEEGLAIDPRRRLDRFGGHPGVA